MFSDSQGYFPSKQLQQLPLELDIMVLHQGIRILVSFWLPLKHMGLHKALTVSNPSSVRISKTQGINSTVSLSIYAASIPTISGDHKNQSN